MVFLYKKYKNGGVKMTKMTISRLVIEVGGSFLNRNMVYYLKAERRRPLLIKKTVHDKEVYYDKGRNLKGRNFKTA